MNIHDEPTQPATPFVLEVEPVSEGRRSSAAPAPRARHPFGANAAPAGVGAAELLLRPSVAALEHIRVGELY